MSPGTRWMRRPAFSFQRVGLRRIFVFVELGHQQVGAFASEGDGLGAADADVATDQQHRLSLELAGSLVVPLAVIGRGSECGFVAGWLLLLGRLVHGSVLS